MSIDWFLCGCFSRRMTLINCFLSRHRQIDRYKYINYMCQRPRGGKSPEFVFLAFSRINSAKFWKCRDGSKAVPNPVWRIQCVHQRPLPEMVKSGQIRSNRKYSVKVTFLLLFLTWFPHGMNFLKLCVNISNWMVFGQKIHPQGEPIYAYSYPSILPI